MCIVFIAREYLSSADLRKKWPVLHTSPIVIQVTTFILQWEKKRVVIKFLNLILTDVNSERGWHSADESPEVWHDWRHGHAYASQWGLCSFQPQSSLQFLDDLCETRLYHLLLNSCLYLERVIKLSASLMFFIAFGQFLSLHACFLSVHRHIQGCFVWQLTLINGFLSILLKWLQRIRESVAQMFRLTSIP